VTDFPALENYMTGLAKSIEPFEVHLTELQLHSISFGGTDYGLLWIDIEETETLRHLHNQINQDLDARFGDTRADHDGPTYHFHMTITLGKQPLEIYQQYFSEILDRRINRRYTVRHLAMFVYDGPISPNREYLTYKILPIGSEISSFV
jgi:2'-5' RNA ligase